MDSKRFLDLKKGEKIAFEKRFYKNVSIEDEKIKDSIFEWICRLEQREIYIKTFSFLFSKYDGIVFPIKVYGHPRNLQIKDNFGNHFYLCYNQYTNITDYAIEKRDKDFDTELTYHLREKDEILLKKHHIMKLDENGKNTPNRITFTYDSFYLATTVTLKTNFKNETIILDFTYKTVPDCKDDEIKNYLFNLANKPKHLSDIWQISDSIYKDISKILEPEELLGSGYSKKTSFSPKNQIFKGALY